MTEPMNDIRRVLLYLKENPNSTVAQIANGAGLSVTEVSAMIKSELNVVRKKGSNGSLTSYSLPVPKGKCCGGACSRNRMES